jgi:hypothetical protein
MRSANFLRGLACLALLLVCTTGAKAQGDPLYDLAQPGTLYMNQQFGTSPSMAVFNNEIYIAYQANDGSHNTMITTSSDGVNFSTPVRYSYLQTHSATGPVITNWNGLLWLAYTGVDGYVYLASSSNGIDFFGSTGGAPTPVIDPAGEQQPANSQPTLAVYNGLLWITAEWNGPGSQTYMETNTTQNGSTFTGANYCYLGPDGEMPQTGAAIGMAVYNNLLYFAFQSQGNWGHNLVVCSSNGATNGPVTNNVYSNLQVGSGLSATAYNGSLYLAYKDRSGNNDLTIAESTDGVTFESNVYTGIQINGNQQLNPSTTVFNSLFYLTHVSNDSGHRMYLTNNQ